MKLAKLLCLSVVSAAIAVVCLPAAAGAMPNLFVNAGFEDPITADGPPFVGFWESFSADGDQDAGPDTARVDSSMPRNGAQALQLIIDNQLNTFAGVFQDVDGLSAGQVVNFSGWHKQVSGDAGGIQFRIEYRDSVNGVEISRTGNFSPTPGTAYESFLVTDAVPADADTARVVYAIQSFGGALNQEIYVDDVSFTAIPEPASLVLLGVGLTGIGVGYRRRRS